LASSKTDLFVRAVGAILDAICTVINTSAIPRLLVLNGTDLKFQPTIAHGDISAPDLNELGAFLQRLALAGYELFPNPDLEHFLLSAAGLPVPDTGSEADEPEELFPGLDEDALEYDPDEPPDGQTVQVPATLHIPSNQLPRGGQGAGGGAPGANQQGDQSPAPRGLNPPADQNRRTGRTTQSAAARQIRKPGAIRRAATEVDAANGGVVEDPEAFHYAGKHDQGDHAGKAHKSVSRSSRQKATMIRALLSAGNSPSSIAKYLGIRPQHVHTVRKRMVRGLKAGAAAEVTPTAQQGIINAIR
jgi:hypothetical protein